MKALGAICLFSVGGLIESGLQHAGHDAALWGMVSAISGLAWCWSALFSGAARLLNAIAGKRPAHAHTDPRILASEVEALNAQLAQLRDTATSFDVSFDKTLVCLDERLRQVEQRSNYSPPTIPVGNSR